MFRFFTKIILFFSLVVHSVTSVHAQIKYVRYKPENTQIVVFVHGITGSGLQTWTNTDTRAYWPTLLSGDSAFNRANIATFEFSSPRIGLAPSIDELAESMRLSFQATGVLAHRQIVFIAHSMGGLVIRAFLTRYRDQAKKVGLIYFFATPTTGSSTASLIKYFSRNHQFTGLSPIDSNSYLASLQQDWIADPVLKNIRSFCAYEIQQTGPQILVPLESATHLCNAGIDPINKNHENIVKPTGRDDVPYIAFKMAYTTLNAKPLKAERDDTIWVNKTGVMERIDRTEYCKKSMWTILRSDGSIRVGLLGTTTSSMPQLAAIRIQKKLESEEKNYTEDSPIKINVGESDLISETNCGHVFIRILAVDECTAKYELYSPLDH